MDRAGGHYPQQTNTETENEVLHVLTYKWELNDGNIRTFREEQNTLGPFREWKVEREIGKITNGY